MMEVRLLGTGAADGIPSFFCDNEVSRYARKYGGKDVRSRSGALIDGHLKIDLPPDTHAQMARDRLSARDWTALIFTHGHDDHFARREVQYALFPFTSDLYLPFIIYGNDRINAGFAEAFPDWPIEVHLTKSFESFTHLDYQITPIAARHKEDEDSQNLIFQRDGTTVLYGTDTGVWSHQTFSFLQDYKIDLLIIECTDGLNKATYEGHLDIEACVGVVEALRESHVLHDRSRVVTTHHAARGMAKHAELERILAKYNMEPGYDGMVLHV
jgi:phosphoribosyl 1,2-cyclic phosphate phosphodiesterase